MILDAFIPWLLYSSLTGGILTGLILVLRLVVKNKLGANWQYMVWFLLILKLLIPYTPESSLSLFNLFNHLPVPGLTINYFAARNSTHLDQRTENNSSAEKTVNSSDDYALSINKTFFVSKTALCLWLWLMGVVSLTAYLIHSTIKLKYAVKNGFKINDSGIVNLLEDCRLLMNSKSTPILIELSGIQSPKVIGAIHPHIILPSGLIENLSMAEIRFILLHELSHIQRKDLYLNWIISYLQIIHWFNPFIWYAFYQMRQDRELACDAYVLSLLKPNEYKSYGAAIVSLLEKFSHPVFDYTTAGLASGKAHIKKRIAMIACYKKGTSARFIGGILLILLLGCIVLPNAKVTSGSAPPGELSRRNDNISYEDLSSYFRGYDGTFVLLDMENERYQIYNASNSQIRVSPNSTYKIISSLVGLETGVLTDENTRLTWDGTIYPIGPWNKDQTLSSAMTYSVNWYFQRTDSIVGNTKIEDYLKQIGYGNYDLTGDSHTFWIESSLKISPWEQVEILKKFYTYEMPFSKKNIDIVKKIIKISETNNACLYGKTGSGIVNDNSINGWFVGYVEKGGKAYIFATNIQGKELADGAKAKNITLSILKDKNIL